MVTKPAKMDGVDPAVAALHRYGYPLAALVRREMGGAYPLDVALDVSVGVGRTWDDAGH